MSSTTICKEAKALVKATTLSLGKHLPPSWLGKAGPSCVIELARHVEILCNISTWTLKDKWEDTTSTVDRSLESFSIVLNDSITNERRFEKLKPYALKLLNTRATLALERRRLMMMTDFAVRAIVPLHLEAWDRPLAAAQFRELSPLVNGLTCRTAISLGRDSEYRYGACIGAAIRAAENMCVSNYLFHRGTANSTSLCIRQCVDTAFANCKEAILFSMCLGLLDRMILEK